ncbi:MAG: hypothetical protein JNL11_20035 [Bdellovibrionaceae bacterium]|nr:hypothetical protein [Pseudobdellovibrionaceae bacterium]
MGKNNKKTIDSSGEKKALTALLIIFAVCMATAWIYAVNLRKTVVANNVGINIDANALVEVEKLRNLAESQISNARSFFLLGSRNLYDKQKQDKQSLLEGLASFEKKYSLPGIPEITKNIETLQTQQQEFFDQAMEFREKQTESKIVGQFYQSKTAPILRQINDSLNQILAVHEAEFARVRSEAAVAAQSVESQIPQGMAWLTGFMIFIFLGLSIIIVRMLDERRRQLAERDRLYAEAQNAIQAREEFVAAISHDVKEPLNTLNELGEYLPNISDKEKIRDSGELVKNLVVEIENRIKDICDYKTANLEGLTLRLDQMNVDEVLEDARLLMQPLAKKRDVRLQIEPANPPVLAFLDRERVLRVLSNLVSNAVKFSPKNGKVVVKVRSDQQYVNVSVADSGPGIPENKISDLFTYHWQAPKTADQGSGVGLAVAKTIVEAHGGVIKVSSTGSGTNFTFSLPKRRPAGAQLKKPAPIRYTVNSRSQTDTYTQSPNL